MPADQQSVLPAVRGVPWWGAVLVATVITAIGAAIDAKSSNSLGSIFNFCYLVGCVTAALAVRRRALFTAGAQPPLIAFFVGIITLYALNAGTTSGLRGVIFKVLPPIAADFPWMAVTFLVTLALVIGRWYVTRGAAGASGGKRRARPTPSSGGSDRPRQNRSGSRKATEAVGAARSRADRAAGGRARADRAPSDERTASAGATGGAGAADKPEMTKATRPRRAVAESRATSADDSDEVRTSTARRRSATRRSGDTGAGREARAGSGARRSAEARDETRERSKAAAPRRRPTDRAADTANGAGRRRSDSARSDDATAPPPRKRTTAGQVQRSRAGENLDDAAMMASAPVGDADAPPAPVAPARDGAPRRRAADTPPRRSSRPNPSAAPAAAPTGGGYDGDADDAPTVSYPTIRSRNRR
ncbi:hypothetical protein GCM10009624_12620 [Gordonia sinesedis]